MERICPKCTYKLQSSDNYFCSNCGLTLPNELVFLENNIRVKKYVPLDKLVDNKIKVSNKKKYLNKNLVISLLLVLVIGFSAFFILNSGIVKLILSETKLDSKINQIIASKDKSHNKISINLDIPSSSFGVREYSNHIPSDVQFYFEGSNLTALLGIPLFDPDNEELRNIAKLVLQPEFAGFSYLSDKIVWGFLFAPKDLKIAQDLLGGKLGENWKMAVINDYIVVANDDSVFEKVKSVDGNLIPSLSKNPEFLTSKKNLDMTGQFQVCFLKDASRDLVRGSLSGLTAPTIGMISEILNSPEKCLVVSTNL